MTDAYHSALTPELPDLEPVYSWEGRGSVARVHDVSTGLLPDMHDCAVLYTELPWADGMPEFRHRSDAYRGVHMPYEMWAFKLTKTLLDWGRPFVIVAGRQALRHMAAEWVRPCQLQGSTAVAFGAGLPAIERSRAEGVLAELALRYGSVADPCCGYGRTARVFAEQGKRFVVSDTNARCIGYIAKHAPDWQRR